jgi:signal transduction histidine kinase
MAFPQFVLRKKIVMIQQNTLTVESTEFTPTNSDSFTNRSPDLTHRLCQAIDGHERRVLNYTAKLAQANEQLRHEIKEHRNAVERLVMKQQYLCHLLELGDRDHQAVSRDIHDGLVQQLAAAAMRLRALRQLPIVP